MDHLRIRDVDRGSCGGLRVSGSVRGHKRVGMSDVVYRLVRGTHIL